MHPWDKRNTSVKNLSLYVLFSQEVPGERDPLSFYKSFVHMHVNNTKLKKTVHLISGALSHDR